MSDKTTAPSPVADPPLSSRQAQSLCDKSNEAAAHTHLPGSHLKLKILVSWAGETVWLLINSSREGDLQSPGQLSLFLSFLPMSFQDERGHLCPDQTRRLVALWKCREPPVILGFLSLTQLLSLERLFLTKLPTFKPFLLRGFTRFTGLFIHS